MRKIASENFVGNSHSSKNEDTRSFVEIVYDELDDVGATGIPHRIIDDPTERTGDGSAYRVYTWPNLQTIGTHLFVGDILNVSADLFQDQALTTAGGYACISVFAQNSSGGIIDEKRIDSRGGAVGQYIEQSEYYTIPAGAASVGCTFYHFPSTVKTGTSKVKNVVLTKVSRIPKETGTAAIGVNGIRMTTMKEQDANGNDNPIDKLLSLPTGEAGTSSSKIINSGNFAEMDTLLSDSNTYTSGSAASVYEFKNWGSAVKISSLNLKPGDSVIITGELSRDSTAIANGKYPWVVIEFSDANDSWLATGGIEGQTAIPNVFEYFKSEITVPANADNTIFRAVRGPRNVSATGNTSIRNVLFRVNRGA